jgi:hypothetical protein
VRSKYKKKYPKSLIDYGKNTELSRIFIVNWRVENGIATTTFYDWVKRHQELKTALELYNDIKAARFMEWLHNSMDTEKKIQGMYINRIMNVLRIEQLEAPELTESNKPSSKLFTALAESLNKCM